MNGKFFLTGEEFTTQEYRNLFRLAKFLKKNRRQQFLAHKTIALLFEKPSLRTRVSFTLALQELGAQVVDITASQKKAEAPEDTMRVLQGYVDGLMVRTFAHENLERMCSKAKIPLINGLSDLHHPCQVLADLMTLQEVFGDLQGLHLAYIGDGNNILHSLLLMAPFLGVHVHYSCPKNYQPDPEILKRARLRAAPDVQIKSFATAQEAVQAVDCISTDVWTSMGAEAETNTRLQAFAEYQLNNALASQAKEHAIFMHCMPVHEGQEITREIIEHPRSVLFQQSENRLHVQKALLMALFGQALDHTFEKSIEQALQLQSQDRSPHGPHHPI